MHAGLAMKDGCHLFRCPVPLRVCVCVNYVTLLQERSRGWTLGERTVPAGFVANAEMKVFLSSRGP